MAYVGDYHAAVLIRGPDNKFVMIIQHDLWKFAGGGSEAGETPEDTAIRESLEETGLVIERESLTLIHEEFSKSRFSETSSFHKKYYFLGRTSDIPKGIHAFRGNDRERPGIFELSEIETMVDIHPQYFNAYLKAKEAGLV